MLICSLYIFFSGVSVQIIAHLKIFLLLSFKSSLDILVTSLYQIVRYVFCKYFPSECGLYSYSLNTISFLIHISNYPRKKRSRKNTKKKEKWNIVSWELALQLIPNVN